MHILSRMLMPACVASQEFLVLRSFFMADAPNWKNLKVCRLEVGMPVTIPAGTASLELTFNRSKIKSN